MAHERLLSPDAHARADLRLGDDRRAHPLPRGHGARRALPRTGEQAVRALALLLAAVSVPAAAEPTPQQVQTVMQRDFHPRGQATMERLVQDRLQRVCTESRNQPPTELTKALE